MGHADLPVATQQRTTILGLHEAYKARVTTPRVVLEAIQRRVQAQDFGESVHSPFVSLNDAANDDVVQSAARYAAGIPRGPLDGVPVVVKDEVDMVGLPTMGGTSYRTALATKDGWWIKKLRDAGAVIVGKTHATEWGLNASGFPRSWRGGGPLDVALDKAAIPRDAWRLASNSTGDW